MTNFVRDIVDTVTGEWGGIFAKKPTESGACRPWINVGSAQACEMVAALQQFLS